MVKIIDITSKQEKEKEQTEKVSRLAKQIFPEGRYLFSHLYLVDDIYEKNDSTKIISFNCITDYTVNVYKKENFEKAKQYAEGLEKIFEEEFTLKTDYSK